MFGGKKLIRSFSALVLSVGMAATAAGYVYVDSDAVGNNDGTRWEDAYNHLADALAATSDGEIWVAQGVYRPDQGAGVTAGDKETTFQLKNGVVLKGGYAGYGEADPDARDIELYETILSGDLDANDGEVSDPRNLPDASSRQENSYHVVTGSGTGQTAVLDGFTIVGGNAHDTHNTFDMYDHRIYGGGLYNYTGSPTVIECTFRENSADHLGGGMCNRQGSHPTVNRCKFMSNGTANVRYIPDEDESAGGGVANLNGSSPSYSDCVFEGNWSRHAGGMGMAWDSNPTLEKCSFIGNSAQFGGGGVFALNSCSPELSHCEFIENSALFYGGGFRCYGDCNPILSHCNFIGNSADSVGGGMASQVRCQPQLNFCIFSGNQAPICGGYDNFYSSSTLTNCTIADNVNGGVVLAYGDVTLTNCILVGNSPEIEIDGGTALVNYSNVEGGWAGVDNIDSDPCFANANAGDYHLKSEAGRWDPNGEAWVYDDVTSPCIDKGNPASDWTGELWPHGKRINMGAYGGTAEASMSESTVGSAADCNNDDAVDGFDLLMVVSRWLDDELLIPEDIDRNGTVDFYDYAEMAGECSLK